MNKALAAIALAAGWAGCLPGSATASVSAAEEARGVDDPLAFVTAHYAAYQRQAAGPDEPAHAYSPRLRALFADYAAWTARHEDLVGSLDFDWWVNAQDWVLEDLRISERREGANRRIVSARFRNAGRPDEVRFVFVRQGGRWFLDDAIEGTGSGEGGWTLSALLRERPE
jgi:hypothetical protein